MKNLKTALLFVSLVSLISCGKNGSEEKDTIETNYRQTSNNTAEKNTETNTETADTETENTNIDSDSGLAAAIQRQIQNSHKSAAFKKNQNNTSLVRPNSQAAITQKEAEVVINSPLRNLLKNAEIGKSYSKKELIENYKFPKEAVDLIKKVTCVGPNKLYFNWGSTWFVEKVSDAEFQNDTLIFAFKKNKTYVSGGAIGIKYNKKIYTELILNNGSAYIPSVKGYHWEINK